MPRPVVIVSCIAACSMALMAVLYIAARDTTRYDQSFTRTFNHNLLRERYTLDLNHDGYSIAGATATHFYFVRKETPLSMLVTTTALTDSMRVEISVDSNESRTWQNASIEIDSPFFYVKDGSVPGIFRGMIGEWRARKLTTECPYFKDAVAITPQSFAVQATMSEMGKTEIEYQVGKVKIDSPYVHIDPLTLEKQGDVFYSTAGTLRYSRALQRLVYTYAHRNVYLVMDTSLEVLHKGHTIDTMSHVRIKTVEIADKKTMIPTAPTVVNRNTQLAGTMLLVHSGLKAKNESREDFDNASVIDVYDVATTEYRYSFYLPRHDGHKMTDYTFANNLLIVVYEHHIVAYDTATLLLNTPA